MDTTQRFSIFILAPLFCQISALAQNNEIQIFNTHSLRPFWAQEYTGVDLLREKLLDRPMDWEVSPHLFQIWDSQNNQHGEKVSQLIAGPYASAPIPLEVPFDYLDVEHLIDKVGLDNWLYHCSSTNTCPSYINISTMFPLKYEDVISPTRFPEEDEDATSHIKLFVINPQMSTIVTAAGNEATLMQPSKQELSSSEKIITVGNCDSDGNPDPTSSFSAKTTLCAPSSNRQASYTFAGMMQILGGTSGAAPMVTGALVAFTAITGYSLNSREATSILRKTAIPHPRLPSVSNLGVGMVNVFKIGEVAFRLRETCQGDEYCYARELMSKEAFIFPSNKQKFIGDCQDDQLKELRREALLNPQEGELWEAIACINRKQGLQGHAEYYQQLVKRVKSSDEELIDNSWRDAKYLFLAKYVPFSHRRMEELFPSMLNLSAINRRILRAMALNLIGDEETLNQHEDFLQQIIFHPNIYAETLEAIAQLVSSNAERITGHYKFLQSIVDEHPKVEDTYMLKSIGKYIAKNAKAIPKHRELLQTIIKHSKADANMLWILAITITENAKVITKHRELLQTVIDHPKVDQLGLGQVARSIAYRAENIPAHSQLLQSIIKHEKTDSYVLELVGSAIASNAQKIPDHIKLLKLAIDHPVIKRNALGIIGSSIAGNAKEISTHHQLLQEIIDHFMIKAPALTRIGRAIIYKTKEIPGYYELLEKIIYHPQIDKKALQSIAKTIVQHADDIPEHQKLLQAIYTHPKMRGENLQNISHFLHCSNLSAVYPPLAFIKLMANLLSSDENPSQNCQ